MIGPIGEPNVSLGLAGLRGLRDAIGSPSDAQARLCRFECRERGLCFLATIEALQLQRKIGFVWDSRFFVITFAAINLECKSNSLRSLEVQQTMKTASSDEDLAFKQKQKDMATYTKKAACRDRMLLTFDVLSDDDGRSNVKLTMNTYQ